MSPAALAFQWLCWLGALSFIGWAVVGIARHGKRNRRRRGVLREPRSDERSSIQQFNRIMGR